VDYQVRQALLDDTAAISELFKSRIGVWQRMDERGHAQDVAYQRLSLYERWQHGVHYRGAWMSLETGALHLNHLLGGAGMPLTVVQGDQGVVGYAEVYHGVEAPPLNGVLHIAQLITDPAAVGADDALIDYLINFGKTHDVQQVTLTRASDELLDAAVTRRFSLNAITCVRRYAVPTRAGQVFYRAVDHSDESPAQIHGWAMPIGRLTSAHHLWAMHMTRLWETIPEMRARKTHRLKFSAAGQDAFLYCRQNLYDLRTADVACWTPKGLSVQLVAAIKDWGQREGYRALHMNISDENVTLFGGDIEPEGYTQEICALEMK